MRKRSKVSKKKPAKARQQKGVHENKVAKGVVANGRRQKKRKRPVKTTTEELAPPAPSTAQHQCVDANHYQFVGRDEETQESHYQRYDPINDELITLVYDSQSDPEDGPVARRVSRSYA